jgi:competence protein ComGC
MSVGKIFLLVGCIAMIMVVPIVTILAAILVPNFIRARASGQYTSCKSNEKNIATALEMYACDNQGLYPESMGKLVPNYLKLIPNCPAVQHETYSVSYVVATEPDAYTFCCQGENHPMLRRGQNLPSYNSFEGLRD